MGKPASTTYSKFLKRLAREGRSDELVAADEAEERGVRDEYLRSLMRADVGRKPSDTLFEHGAARQRWMQWAKLEFPLGSLVRVHDDGENRGTDEERVYVQRRVANADGPYALVETEEPLDMQGEVKGYARGHIGELPMVYVVFTNDWQWYMNDGDLFYEDEITVLRRGRGARSTKRRMGTVGEFASLSELRRHR